tara:strand:+ start:1762 stop:4992 length:3231 start_codon:yes stop_codon:yes gene_type:complete
MAYQDINTSGWKENISYKKYDPVYFKRSLAPVLDLNSWDHETGIWQATNNTHDGIFYGQSVKTNPVVGNADPITGDQIISTPRFKINPLSNYKASVFIAKKDDNVNTENKYKRDILDNGAGIRISFYDAAGSKIYAGVNLVKTHKLTEVNKISTTKWQALNLDLSFRDIPQFGNVAVSGSLDLVVYGQKRGPVYFSGAKIYNENEYHYATEDHTSSLLNSPTGSLSKWTQKFQHNASYGSSVFFKSENIRNDYGDGYYRISQKGINPLRMQADLRFEARTDQEAKSILHFLKAQKGARPFFFTMADPYNKELPYFCEEYNHVKNFTNNNTITATFLNDSESVLTKSNIFLSESPSRNRYLNWEAQSYKVNDVTFYQKDTMLSGAAVGNSPTSIIYATGDENYYYKKSDLANVEALIRGQQGWIVVPDMSVNTASQFEYLYFDNNTTSTKGWFYRANTDKWYYAVNTYNNGSPLPANQCWTWHNDDGWVLETNVDLIDYWNTGIKTQPSFKPKIGSDDSVTPEVNDNWTKDLFFWKPSLGTQIDKNPRILKADNNKVVQRNTDGLNEDLITFNVDFNSRSDREAASILHFLEQKKGFKAFDVLLPDPYGQKYQYSGDSTAITGDRSIYNSVSVNDNILFTDASGGYPDAERRIKSIELISGDLDYNFEHGVTKIRLDKPIPSYYNMLGGIPSGDNSFSILKRFHCDEWSHNYVFDDNNNISAKLSEVPNIFRAKPDLHIDGDIFADVNTPINYNIKAKDPEGIYSYHFYNSDGPQIGGDTITGVSSFSITEPITFTKTGLNVLKLRAENSVGVYNEISYDVMVGNQLSTFAESEGYNRINANGIKVVNFGANSFKFISGVKFWWNDESEPDYTDITSTNKKIESYNSRLSGATTFSSSTYRRFSISDAPHKTFNFKAKDMAGNEDTASELIAVDTVGGVNGNQEIFFKGSDGGVYLFENKYYREKPYNNNNFVSSADLSAIAFVPFITGDVTYTWSFSSVDRRGVKYPTLHAPIGSVNDEGNYFNVSAELENYHASGPSHDSFLKVIYNVTAVGLGNGGQNVTARGRAKFVFNWIVD